MKPINYLCALLMGLMPLIITSCSKEKGNHRHHKEHFVPVTTYYYHDSANDDFWLYMMLMNNNGSTTYYTVSSPTPISDFSSSSWTATPTQPPALVEAQSNPAFQVGQESVAVSEFGPQLEATINDNAEYFEGMTTEEMGDYEGGGSDAKAPEEESEQGQNETSSESESSSNSDSGGGDSGGGDGGSD